MNKKLISIGLACCMFVCMAFPINAFASTKGFISDTVNDFTIQKSTDYTIKITPDNQNSSVSVSTGDSTTARVISTTKTNDSYYIIITASGKTNSCTGLYVKLDSNQIKLCNITVGYSVETTGKHINNITQKDGTIVSKLVQDKGWQLQIEKKPINFTKVDSYGHIHNDNITLRTDYSNVNTNEKYLIIQYGGVLGYINGYPDEQLKFTTSTGKELKYESYDNDILRFKVLYDNIDDIKTMYFGTDTEKATLKMIYFS